MPSRVLRSPWFTVLAALGALAGTFGAQDLGHPGPSLAGCGPTVGNPTPTETRSESKLWFHDRTWWGSLWSASAQAFRIHRLDPATHAWIDTGVAIEARPDSHSDALRVGEQVYIATHEFTQGSGSPGNPILLLRYSYAAGAYTLDPGFPVTIGDSSTASLVIERDSTGTLWAVWMQGRRVRVTHSLGSDLAWSAPTILPACTSDTSSDDICGLIHFGGDRLGVLWSDEEESAFFFSERLDGDPAETWQPVEVALAGEADDHLNLKSDAEGKVYAVIKNQHDEVKLLVRSAGTWSQHLVANAAADFTRPIVLLDPLARSLLVFATRNGEIRQKISALDAIAFPAGTGTAVMRDSDGTLNDPTSTKQSVTARSGLVVLASNPTVGGNYWHHEVAPVAKPGKFALAPAPPLGAHSVNLPLVVSGATPWAEVVFFASLPGLPGRTFTPGLPPAARYLGRACADEHGVATLTVSPPRGLPEPLRYLALEPATRRAARP